MVYISGKAMGNSGKIALFLFFVSLWFTAFTQSGIREGYVVFNNQSRTGCLIRNIGSEESTMDYQYKLKGDQEFKKVELSKIEEFGIDHLFKCVRAFISMDVSDGRISDLKDTAVTRMEGHAYIKVLVEGGPATLYSFWGEGRTLYLFRTGDTPVTTLFHKRYSLEITPNMPEQVFVNNTYQRQLGEHLAYGNSEETSRVAYSKKALVGYFKAYLKEKQSDYVVYQAAQTKKVIFNLKIAFAINRINLGIEEFSDALPNALFSDEISPGYGVEAELILPFNNYGWSLFADADFVSYHSGKIVNSINPVLTNGYAIDYKSIGLPLGITRYFKCLQGSQDILPGSICSAFHSRRFPDFF